jgi:hypothetical protein
MKRELWFMGLSAAFWLASADTSHAVTLRWGLESRYHIESNESNRSGAIRDWPEARRIFSRQRTVRVFSAKPPTGQLMQCFSRHFEAWEAYRKQQESQSTDEHVRSPRERFTSYKQQNDPACSQFAKEIAPQLYFDFTADTNDNYVLERIEITTLAFGEYKGGGFFEREAWYDILLSHIPGTKGYDVDKRLTFQRTGRVVLRFWSDNFYPNVGWMAPMGAYILNIKFIFTANGRTVSVSTGPFMIDV